METEFKIMLAKFWQTYNEDNLIQCVVQIKHFVEGSVIEAASEIDGNLKLLSILLDIKRHLEVTESDIVTISHILHQKCDESIGLHLGGVLLEAQYYHLAFVLAKILISPGKIKTYPDIVDYVEASKHDILIFSSVLQILSEAFLITSLKVST